MKKIFCTLMALIIMMLSLASQVSAQTAEKTLTVLFTHDNHSYIEEKEDGTGGFARLATVIKESKAEDPDTLVLDGGDFSMGTLFQSVYSTQATELRLLGLLGYDATTIGNHEYDYGANGLADMLLSAKDSGDALPEILCCNIDWENSSGEYTKELKSAMNEFGVKDYTVIKKGDVNVALFGLMGTDADACAPDSGLSFRDISDSAKEVVAEIKKNEDADMIVCLSHSGTNSDKAISEDEILAKNVPEIDLIISGHTHSIFEEPIKVGNTVIASGGEYVQNMGKIKFTQNSSGRWDVSSYELVNLNSSVVQDKDMLKKISEYKKMTNEYLKRFGYSDADEVIAYSPFDFIGAQDIYSRHEEETLGNLLADSYIYAVKQAEGENYTPVDIAVVPNGIIRSSFNKGEVKVEAAFEALSLGIGPDEIPGYPLVSIYITGKELKTAAEIDASVSELMEGTQLFFSGLSFTFNPNRLILNRVTNVSLMAPDGELSDIDDDKLYRVVADLYSGMMLSAVNSTSYGLLSLSPKDKNGNELTEFESSIIYTEALENGKKRELKAWYALASYLQSFDKINGLSTIPDEYESVQGRKIIDDSSDLLSLIKNPNKIAFIVLGVIVLLILIIVLIVVLIVKCCKRIKRKRKAKAENNI